MARNVAIGIQQYNEFIEKNYFYIDKTAFIKEWWDSGDSVTLITRPRRFGKTLNMSMVEQFFSIDYKNRGDLFEGLSIWKEENYRQLQGTYPVVSLSFARVKETNYITTREKICEILRDLFIKFSFVKESDVLTDADRAYFNRILELDVRDSDATSALYQLSNYLYRYYGKKVIILLDEYDTPMQEAYVDGYWSELAAFTRSMFNSAFKTNPWLERGMMTGITRVSKDSIFSDLNNLEVVTTTSDKYATTFGFTEQEVFAALEECGLAGEKDQVKRWYDGFIFGAHKDIYNPWSILNFLDSGNFTTYWANTSSNSLVSKLLQEGNRSVKEKFETGNERAVWSLLLASGYLKAMNAYMNRVALQTFSYFDVGNRPSIEEPERFYHGFVLGLIVDLKDRYLITSNRESGFGRYDVMLEPRNPKEDDAIILEFKVHDPEDEATLKDTVQVALVQIEQKQYMAQLEARGIPREHIRSYGFAFQGKKVLIG